MNKLRKFTKALGRICRHPYLLNLILQDEDTAKEETICQYGFENGLPLLDPEMLFPDFDETVSPYAYLSGATTPIDLALLKALAKRYSVQDYFEIGTWRGESVANVAGTVPHCVTMNLSKEQIASMTKNRAYADLHGLFSRDLQNVEQLYGDSQQFDFSPYFGKFDMIFIDSDHHREAVVKDTQTAFRLRKNDNSIIVWHDYAYDPESIRWNVLSAILEGTPSDHRHRLYHIANTLCAVCLPEKFDARTLVPYEKPQHYYELEIRSKKM